jgi:hypothetical protein
MRRPMRDRIRHDRLACSLERQKRPWFCPRIRSTPTRVPLLAGFGLSDRTPGSRSRFASSGLGAMVQLSAPLQFVLVALAGWVNHQQREMIDYLQEENRALREQLGPGRYANDHEKAHSRQQRVTSVGGRVRLHGADGGVRCRCRRPLIVLEELSGVSEGPIPAAAARRGSSARRSMARRGRTSAGASAASSRIRDSG